MINYSSGAADGDQVIKHLGLQPHPEGGWYRETWRGASAVEGERGIGTAILFLLRAGERSRWHRVDATEIWLFHAGAPLTLLTAPNLAATPLAHRLGPQVLDGDRPQHAIAADEWQAAEAREGWCLVSCIVVPAFEFAGFELAPDDGSDEGERP